MSTGCPLAATTTDHRPASVPRSKVVRQSPLARCPAKNRLRRSTIVSHCLRLRVNDARQTDPPPSRITTARLPPSAAIRGSMFVDATLNQPVQVFPDRPADLPRNLQDALKDPEFLMRLGAVQESTSCFRSKDPGLAMAARQALADIRRRIQKWNA